MNREGAEINLSAGEVAGAFTRTMLEKANSVQEQTHDVSTAPCKVRGVDESTK